jgi:tetratricopeptide (TPR) repeat protein
LLEQATEHIEKKEWEIAREDLEEALDYYPNYAEAMSKLGYIHIKLNFSEKSKEEVLTLSKRALEISDKSSLTWLYMGITYYYLKKFDKARDCCQKALEIDPRYKRAWNNLGNVYLGKNEEENAINCYKKALNIDPQYKEVWYNLGITYRREKKYKKAIECYEKALEIDSTYKKAWYNLGNVYFDEKKYEKAIECYIKAIEIDANYIKALNFLGTVYLKLNSDERAIECFDKVLKIDPQNKRALTKLEIYYSKRTGKKKFLCYDVENIYRKDKKYWNELIQKDERVKEIKKAIDIFKKTDLYKEFKGKTDFNIIFSIMRTSPTYSYIRSKTIDIHLKAPLPLQKKNDNMYLAGHYLKVLKHEIIEVWKLPVIVIKEVSNIKNLDFFWLIKNGFQDFLLFSNNLIDDIYLWDLLSLYEDNKNIYFTNMKAVVIAALYDFIQNKYGESYGVDIKYKLISSPLLNGICNIQLFNTLKNKILNLYKKIDAIKSVSSTKKAKREIYLRSLRKFITFCKKEFRWNINLKNIYIIPRLDKEIFLIDVDTTAEVYPFEFLESFITAQLDKIDDINERKLIRRSELLKSYIDKLEGHMYSYIHRKDISEKEFRDLLDIKLPLYKKKMITNLLKYATAGFESNLVDKGTILLKLIFISKVLPESLEHSIFQTILDIFSGFLR